MSSTQIESTVSLVSVSHDRGQNESKSKRPSAIEAISQGASLPPVPSFTDIEKKRQWMLEHMAGAFRMFARKGYTEGMAGHISLRDPERLDCFWTNPYVPLG